MPQANDYAVIVGAQTYPGLDDPTSDAFHPLLGPVNDATAFYEWVTSPDGGDVPAANADLIAKIYPVYSWDTSPPVFTLMVTNRAALEELNLYGSGVTEAELERACRDCGVEENGAGDRLRDAIKAFYDARKDRRIGKGYTPSDSGNFAP